MSFDHVERHKHFKKESPEQQKLRQANGPRRVASHYSIDVPPSVLGTLKAHYQRVSEHKRKAEEARDDVEDTNPRPKKQKKPVESIGVRSSSPEQPISWSSSPVRTRPPPSPDRFNLRAAPNFSLPPSSIANDEETENAGLVEGVSIPHGQTFMQSQAFDLPRPSTDISATPDRSRLANTPPCAQRSQNVVPGTALGAIPAISIPLDKDWSVTEQPGLPQQRPRRMKRFDEAAVLRDAAMRKEPGSPRKHSGSDDTTSVDQSPPEKRVASPQRAEDDVAVIGEDTVMSAPSPQVSSTAMRPSSAAAASIVHSIKPQAVPTSPAVAVTEFEAFMETYPEYTSHGDTLTTFLTACIALEWARNNKRLHEFLWDDFIRVFTMSYLPYVKSKQGSLAGLDFYNVRGEKPLWIPSKMVKASTLDRILDFYRDRVRELRPRVKVEDETAQNKRPLGRSLDNSVLRSTASTAEAAAQASPVTPSAEVQPSRRRHTMGPLRHLHPTQEAISTPVSSAEARPAHLTPLSQLPYFKSLRGRDSSKNGSVKGKDLYRKIVQRKSTGTLPYSSITS
jgi:hypothetical protein